MSFQSLAIDTWLGAAFLAVAAYRDWRYTTVPNLLLGLFLLSFFPAAWLSGMPFGEFTQRCAIFAATLLAVLMLFSLRVIGGGGGKLVAITTLWLPTPTALGFIIVCVVLTGTLYLAWRFSEARWLEFIAEKFASIVAVLGILLLATAG
jgi:Flp pilus assembly protein protease CpaA